MKFLGDMGIAGSTVRWLQARGYDAKHLRDEELQRLPDDEIFAKAETEKRIVLTFDLGFGDIAAAAGKALPSVIIFRLQDQRPANVNRRLEVVLREAATELKDGAIISVDEYRYRIRKLPILP
jgi:predicted nuclease of predicted toxin-antitoxin system